VCVQLESGASEYRDLSQINPPRLHDTTLKQPSGGVIRHEIIRDHHRISSFAGGVDVRKFNLPSYQ
jgi:hypothetical protein